VLLSDCVSWICNRTFAKKSREDREAQKLALELQRQAKMENTALVHYQHGMMSKALLLWMAKYRMKLMHQERQKQHNLRKLKMEAMLLQAAEKAEEEEDMKKQANETVEKKTTPRGAATTPRKTVKMQIVEETRTKGGQKKSERVTKTEENPTAKKEEREEEEENYPADWIDEREALEEGKVNSCFFFFLSGVVDSLLCRGKKVSSSAKTVGTKSARTKAKDVTTSTEIKAKVGGKKAARG
jgi:hypothetical protein